MKRLIWLGFVVAISGCSGGTSSEGTGTSSGGKATTGGGSCATALCGGECCTAGDSCIGNACCPGPLSCGTTCCPSGGKCIDSACCPSSQACGTVCCAGAGADGGQQSCVNNTCCPVARACRDICCDTDSVCNIDSSGNATCDKVCRISSDCDSSTPCCELVDNGQGAFSGQGFCTATPSPATLYQCLCSLTSECSAFLGDGNDECAPLANNSAAITGPYVCAPNDAAANQGCGDGPGGGGLDCTGTDQFCATDPRGNKFCSDECSNTDFLCGNPGVACCNSPCASSDGDDKCCGLCDAGP